MMDWFHILHNHVGWKKIHILHIIEISSQISNDAYTSITKYDKYGRTSASQITQNGTTDQYTYKYTNKFNKKKVMTSFVMDFSSPYSRMKEAVTLYTSGKKKGFAKSSRIETYNEGVWKFSERAAMTYKLDKNGNVTKRVQTGYDAAGKKIYTITVTTSYKRIKLKV